MAQLTAEARSRLDLYLKAIEQQLLTMGKNREERRAIVDDVETQALEMLRATGGSAADVETVLGRMDRPESFGAARKPEKRGRLPLVLWAAFALAGTAPLATTALEMMAGYVYHSVPVVDNDGLPHDAKEMDPGPDHIDLPMKDPVTPGKTWTLQYHLPQRDTRGLHRTWGSYAGWGVVWLIMLPWVLVAAVLAIIGMQRARGAIEYAVGGLAIFVSVVVVVPMLVKMIHG